MELFHLFPRVTSNLVFLRQGMRMFKLAKAAVLVGLLSTLTACTGHVQNTKITAATITCCTRRSPFRRSSGVVARRHSSKLFYRCKKTGDSPVFLFRKVRRDALTLALSHRERVQTLKTVTPLPFCFYLRLTHKPNRFVHRFQGF